MINEERNPLDMPAGSALTSDARRPLLGEANVSKLLTVKFFDR